MATALHGTPVEHDDLVDYISPDEYVEQGDTRVIRDIMFAYTVEVGKDAAGNPNLESRDVPRDAVVSVDQIGLIALRKGEDHHSFYTTRELERRDNPNVATTTTSGPINLSEAGEFELSEWLAAPYGDGGRPPTIDEVLAEVGSDKDLAQRMLQAENIRGDGDPRKGLEAGLTAIIEE